METFPCPKCEREFYELDQLHNHVLNAHQLPDLIDYLEVQMLSRLTKNDFKQVDSHWIYTVGSFHLSLEPDQRGVFRLSVFGTVEPLPPQTAYPTEPEWDTAIRLANKFIDAYNTALDRE